MIKEKIKCFYFFVQPLFRGQGRNPYKNFVAFLVNLKTPKLLSEINWPLEKFVIISKYQFTCHMYVPIYVLLITYDTINKEFLKPVKFNHWFAEHLLMLSSSTQEQPNQLHFLLLFDFERNSKYLNIRRFLLGCSRQPPFQLTKHSMFLEW